MMNRDIPLLEAEHRYDYEWAISYVLACELFPQKISLLPHAAFSLTEFIVQQYGFLANVCNCTMAQYRLGLLYLSGRLEIPPDPDEARQLFHLAAAQGFVPAQEKLSELGL
jgi:TPR repeat protein